jgi:hypothetical protein
MSVSYNNLSIERERYNQLDSDGKWQCPDCGLSNTTPYPGCSCPWSLSGYGGYMFTRHINLYHHNCKEALANMREYGSPGWRSKRFTRLYH